ncbi:hypothetical protein OH76DRAFT_1479113 [Lentinus brumalis]|uniref:BTB domain-containing protein n=1 Tax=Lentinus brumalis TaxID=2498619 RepID=A0A371DNG6_9APHY|nr:hypothetical protein OH76DRAFT_1479113 [Polyporus brumalis]
MAQPVSASLQPHAETVIPPQLAADGPEDDPAALRTAPPPFDKASTDVIIRTADHVDFHVWKCLLGEVSQVYADMFQLNTSASAAEASPLPISHTERGDGKPVVHVTETSAVIEPLLRTFYPPPNFTFSTIDELRPVIAAADKYCMDGVLQVLKHRLLSSFVSEEPLRVYAIGDDDDDDEYFVELDTLSANAYRRLLSYRRRYRKQLKKALQDLAWLADGAWTFMHCSSCVGGTTTYSLRGSASPRPAALWFTSHYQRIGDKLKAWPSRKAIEGSLFCEQALKEASRCVVCREVVHEHMRLFMQNLRVEIDRLIEEVAATINIPT